MAEWQPISTAPRDGSYFVTVRAGNIDSYELGCYDKDTLWWFNELVGLLATHWMPVPPPPPPPRKG